MISGCSRSGKKEITDPVPDITSLTSIAEYKLSVTEPSGLFYYRPSGTLFMVSDNFKNYYEMSAAGQILSTTSIYGTDLEGIVLSRGGDTVSVVEEGLYTVSKFLRNGVRVETFKDVTSSNPSHAFEGVTIDGDYNYYVINESGPCLLVKFDHTGKELWRRELNYSADLSDICYDSKTESLWVLSDESKLLMKLKMDGALISKWSIPVNQAEGLAMSDSSIYICSDIDAKLYVFRRP